MFRADWRDDILGSIGRLGLLYRHAGGLVGTQHSFSDSAASSFFTFTTSILLTHHGGCEYLLSRSVQLTLGFLAVCGRRLYVIYPISAVMFEVSPLSPPPLADWRKNAPRDDMSSEIRML